MSSYHGMDARTYIIIIFIIILLGMSQKEHLACEKLSDDVLASYLSGMRCK